MLRRLTALLIALALAPACDYEETGLPFESAGESVDDASGDADATPEERSETLLLECDFAATCEVLDLSEGSPRPAAARVDERCVLGALADATPGLLQTVMIFEGEGLEGDDGSPIGEASLASLDLAILAPSEAADPAVPSYLGPREVLRQAYGEGAGLGAWINEPMRCTLQERAYFVACLDSGDPACLDPESWVVACEPLGATLCPA